MACQCCRVRKARCDKQRPTCGACAKTGRQCTYVDGTRKRGPKKRNIKDLEARLNDFERRFQNESSTPNGDQSLMEGPVEPGAYDTMGNGVVSANANVYPQMEGGFQENSALPPLDPGLDPLMGIFVPDMSFLNWDFDAGQFGTSDSIGSMPSVETINTLHDIYFEMPYVFMPIVHKTRYLEGHPPLCLQYAIWAVATRFAPQYADQGDTFYQQARAYIEADELKGNGESYVTVAHAQTWSMIGFYEAIRGQFLRGWMSNRRAGALCALMGLDRVDAHDTGSKRSLPAPQDFIDKEQRRRAFWASFCADRWASAGNGWSMAIQEGDVATNLPASNEAYETGVAEDTRSLSEAMEKGLDSNTSAFAANVVVANIMARNMLRLHRLIADQTSRDAILELYRHMNNMLSRIFLTMPRHLGVAAGLRSSSIVHMQLVLHATSISLHQATVQKIGVQNLDETAIQRAEDRCLIAAEEIVDILRMTAHIQPEKMSPFIGYPMHMAATIFARNCGTVNISAETARNNLSLLLSAFERLPKSFESTRMLFRQICTQIERSPFKDLLDGRLERDAAGADPNGNADPSDCSFPGLQVMQNMQAMEPGSQTAGQSPRKRQPIPALVGIAP